MGRRSSKVDPLVEDAPLANLASGPADPGTSDRYRTLSSHGSWADRSPPRPEVPLTQKSLAPATQPVGIRIPDSERGVSH